MAKIKVQRPKTFDSESIKVYDDGGVSKEVNHKYSDSTPTSKVRSESSSYEYHKNFSKAEEDLAKAYENAIASEKRKALGHGTVATLNGILAGSFGRGLKKGSNKGFNAVGLGITGLNTAYHGVAATKAGMKVKRHKKALKNLQED